MERTERINIAIKIFNKDRELHKKLGGCEPELEDKPYEGVLEVLRDTLNPDFSDLFLDVMGIPKDSDTFPRDMFYEEFYGAETANEVIDYCTSFLSSDEFKEYQESKRISKTKKQVR